MEGYFQQDRKMHVNPDGTTVMVPSDLKVGRNVIIGKSVHIGHGVTIEDDCVINREAHIDNDVYIQTGTVIDDHAFIGYGVTVRCNSHVLSRCTIEAGVNNLPSDLEVDRDLRVSDFLTPAR